MVWVARTSRTWLVPMPNAIAPKAPWVAVCESPQAIVVPGCVIPCSGPDHVDDALLAGGQVEISDAEVIAVFPDGINHLRGQRIGRLVLVDRRHDVVDRRERALGKFHLQPQIAEHAERLRGRDLMDEVGADEELRAPVGQRAHAV